MEKFPTRHPEKVFIFQLDIQKKFPFSDFELGSHFRLGRRKIKKNFDCGVGKLAPTPPLSLSDWRLWRIITDWYAIPAGVYFFIRSISCYWWIMGTRLWESHYLGRYILPFSTTIFGSRCIVEATGNLILVFYNLSYVPKSEFVRPSYVHFT